MLFRLQDLSGTRTQQKLFKRTPIYLREDKMKSLSLLEKLFKYFWTNFGQKLFLELKGSIISVVGKSTVEIMEPFLV